MKAVLFSRTWGTAGVLAALLAACSSIGPPTPGATVEQVHSRWGEPRASYELAEGQRLFYRRKPGELQRLDFDAHRRLIASEQVLTAANLRTLAQGHWEAAEVQRSFGPAVRQSAAGGSGEESGSVWTYSFLDFGVWRLARVRMNAAGIVQGVEFLEDPQADDRYR